MANVTRYKLVPATIGTAWYVEGLAEAQTSAANHYGSTGVPVLICEAPVDGIVRHVQTVGGMTRKR